MKSFKKAIKICVIIFFALALLLSFGVLLPKKSYKQKNEVTSEFLITHCNIVDVKSGTIIPNRQVLVQAGRIISIDSLIFLVPGNIKEINANGQYLVPSLWDMHIHTLSLSPQLHFPLLIANGVTGIRDMGDGDSWISNINNNSTRDKAIWERQYKEEGLLIPKIIQSTSYHIEDVENTDSSNYIQKVAELVARLKARGEPFGKLQLEESKLPDYIFYELQHQGSKQGLQILGHLPPNVNIHRVIDNKFKSIEHAWALIPHFVKVKKEFKKDIDQKSYDLANQDAATTQQALLKMAHKSTWYVPTHVSSNRKEYLAFDSNYNNNPNNIYTENVQLFLWKILNWIHTKGYDKENDWPVLKSYYHRGLEITRLANESAVKILAGTDALDRNVYYGFSLHDELGEMVKAGLSNAEALRTATVNAAAYYGVTDDYGSIEIGKRADFILLEKNPLENITNTKSINAIYYNLRWYDKSDLQNMKTFVQKQANSFGISCRFIWNMIKRQ